MQFPHLVWAIAQRRQRNYELASAIGVSESKFSRAMRGLLDFSPEQRQRIATILDLPENWLFQKPRPPGPTCKPAQEKVAVPM